MHKRLYVLAMTILSLAIVILCFAVLAKPDSTFAASLEIVGDKLGISLLQDSPLFNVENMAPGDTENSTVMVKNDGDSIFSLSVESKKESGDELLFKNLIFTIENKGGTILYYSGPLDSLKNVELGSIFQGEEKMLNLRMYFPTDMGNEFQQKTLSVAFIFTAYMSDSMIVVNDEDVPLAPVITAEPEPITNPVLINIPDDSIPSMGETSPEVYYIAGLIMVMIVLKTVQIFMKRSRHVDCS